MTSEAEAQQQIQLRAAAQGTPLLRNNNGAATDATGRLVRYGLGNDSVKINKTFKSSDLIGIFPMVVEPQHVGRTFGLFFAVEVKRSGWSKPTNEREIAQANFGRWVQNHGGLFTFATKSEDVWGNG